MATMCKFWNTGEFNLFKWTDDGLYYLPRVGITSIIWDRNDDSECPYCGSSITNGICKGCQNTSFSSMLGSAQVTFTSILPDAIKYIFDLPTGTVIDAVHIWLGERHSYENHNGGLRFKIINIINRRIPHLIANGPDDVGVIHFQTAARCKVELLFKQDQETE